MLIFILTSPARGGEIVTAPDTERLMARDDTSTVMVTLDQEFSGKDCVVFRYNSFSLVPDPINDNNNPKVGQTLEDKTKVPVDDPN